MPKLICEAIHFGPNRYAMADTVVRLVESVRADYGPADQKLWVTFEEVLIMHRMWTEHKLGRLSSAADIGRAIGTPRATVQRRLRDLVKRGAVTRIGSGYAIVPDYLNAPHGVLGFKRRAKRWHEADVRIEVKGDGFETEGEALVRDRLPLRK